MYKRVPVTIRRKLDRALLLRPEGCASLDAVLDRFKLSDRFGITREGLRTYARKIEQLAEPYLAGHLAAAVLGCMPATYRNQIAAGSQIILMSRVVQALTKDEAKLEAPDLLKLASTLRSAAQRNPTTSQSGTHRQGGSQRPPGANKPEVKTDQEALAEAVRAVYGLDWPVKEPAQAATPANQQPVMEK